MKNEKAKLKARAKTDLERGLITISCPTESLDPTPNMNPTFYTYGTAASQILLASITARLILTDGSFVWGEKLDPPSGFQWRFKFTNITPTSGTSYTLSVSGYTYPPNSVLHSDSIDIEVVATGGITCSA